MGPLILSVAVTGGEHGREATPHLPITPLEIARSAHEAFEAGASVVHVHVRDDDGVPGHHLDRYQFVIDYLAERCDMIVNLTTDPGGEVAGDARFLSLDLRPELATLDAGTMQAPTGDRIVEGSLPFLRRLAARMRETGTKPELEIFHTGMIGTCLKLAEEGLIEAPLYFQFVLGAAGYAPGTPAELLGMLGQIPPGSPWSVAGIGRSSVPMIAMGIMLGGHVRVGLEDQVYYRRGELAMTNAQLVARAVRLAEEFGRQVATPTEARELLALLERAVG